jgi:peroxidase
VFSSAQLAELKKTALAKIICENGDSIEHVQRDVFLNAAFPDQMSRCEEIEDVSLEPWRNCCQENAVGLCAEPVFFQPSIEKAKREV